MSDVLDNPMGTDGFEFVEYTAPDPQLLRTLFERLGFPVVARHRSKNVTLHRQGEINFIINAEPQSLAQAFARQHGPSACAMAFRVRDAAAAFRRALELGAKPGPQSAGPMELNIPCIEGIGAHSSTWSTCTANARSMTWIFAPWQEARRPKQQDSP